MPRWLSEGISVYEERQENPAWGQTMTPQYRELILEDEKEDSEGGGGATPVSKLSGAFLRPPSPMHLQFAYFESSMVVEYVIERWGAGALSRVLMDLANDIPINAALANHTEPIEKLDESFAIWFKEKAKALAPKVDWERPDVPPDASSEALAKFNRANPNNFRGLLAEGRALIAERKVDEAKAPLNRAAELYPEYGEDGGPYELLAKVYRELGDVKLERQMLEKHVALNAEAVEPRLRLSEIAKSAADWAGVRKFAEQMLAVNPLVPAPHRYLAQAAEATNDRALAIESHRTLLLLDPLDRADHHFRVAQLLTEEKQYAVARQEAVMALEEAPRFRQAQRLLLEIVDTMERSGLPAAPYPATTAPALAPEPSPTTQEAAH
jgi:tetratricopeptide (TPR) repeat protein